MTRQSSFPIVNSAHPPCGKSCSRKGIAKMRPTMLSHGLPNGSCFAESTVHSYGRRGYGTLRIQQELHRRGVSREDAAAAMEDYAPDDAMLLALLDKKLQGDLSDPKAVQRAIAYLQRRGFPWSDIRRALNEYGAALDEQFDG